MSGRYNEQQQAWARKYWAKNKDKIKTQRQDRKRRDWDGHKQRLLQTRLRVRYGLTPDVLADMTQAQDGVCKICGTVGPRGLMVDHDHITSKVRGLLCEHCNRGLGGFKDDVELLRKATEYLI